MNCNGHERKQVWQRAQGSQITPQLWVAKLEPATCHPSGAQNLKVALRFLKNKWTPGHQLEAHTNDNMMCDESSVMYVRFISQKQEARKCLKSGNGLYVDKHWCMDHYRKRL